MELLKQSALSDALLKAEKLLAATDDNSHWTNYSQASKVLRETYDQAAIPLLLRYIVLHSRRSACHVMIPEYTRTISLIAGKELPALYEAGPNLDERMRKKIQALCNDWWRDAKATLTTDPSKMSALQLGVIAKRLLEQVRRDGDFTGAGGKRDSVYGAYHNVYYRLRSQDAAERIAAAPLYPSMLPALPASSGFRTARDERTAVDPVVVATMGRRTRNHCLAREPRRCRCRSRYGCRKCSCGYPARRWYPTKNSESASCWTTVKSESSAKRSNARNWPRQWRVCRPNCELPQPSKHSGLMNTSDS